MKYFLFNILNAPNSFTSLIRNDWITRDCEYPKKRERVNQSVIVEQGNPRTINEWYIYIQL